MRRLAEGEQHLPREAVEVVGTRATRPITTAGLILAASFGLLALISLTTFHTVALAMGLGLLLGAFLVRQLLMPALVVLLGRTWQTSGAAGEALYAPSERLGCVVLKPEVIAGLRLPGVG